MPLDPDVEPVLIYSQSRASMDTLASSDDKTPIFSQAISEAFEPYLSIWVQAQDKCVVLAHCRMQKADRSRNLATMLPKYRQQTPKPPDEDFSPQMVIPSSTELFSFYRLTLAQCSKLSNGDSLVELTKVFAKYLDQYAQQVLLYYVSERPSGQTPSKMPQLEDIVMVLNTADYCFTTCTQLEEKIKSRVDEAFKSNIDLQSQADAFMGVASATVRTLVHRVEADIEPSWREMRNTGWSKMESVGDQSSYVGDLIRRIDTRASEILGMLHKQQYARAFCDNVVELVANAYVSNIFQCKPVSEAGAEQVSLLGRTLRTTRSHRLRSRRCSSTCMSYRSPSLTSSATLSPPTPHHQQHTPNGSKNPCPVSPPYSKHFKSAPRPPKPSYKPTSSTSLTNQTPISARSLTSKASPRKITLISSSSSKRTATPPPTRTCLKPPRCSRT